MKDAELEVALNQANRLKDAVRAAAVNEAIHSKDAELQTTLNQMSRLKDEEPPAIWLLLEDKTGLGV